MKRHKPTSKTAQIEVQAYLGATYKSL